MKLLTKELLTKFEKQPKEDVGDDTKVIAHFFNPTGSGDWYAIEYDPQDKIFFGLAHITDAEFGTWSLEELESFKGTFGLGIERDLHFRPMTVRELKTKYNIEW